MAQENEIKILMHNDAPFQCILDGCQFVKFETVNAQPIGDTEQQQQETEEAQSKSYLIKFHFVKRMAEILKSEAEREEELRQKKEAMEREIAEEKARRYEIVEKIKLEIAIKENQQKLSLVDKYALEAQKDYLQVSMEELRNSGNFSCPKKYLDQRDTPLEIPMECIRKLCDTVDRDFDDRISIQELKTYIEKKELPFEEGVAEAMFEDAIKGRGYINESQRVAPLAHEEVAATVRGRHCWDKVNKRWHVVYPPFRNYWIVLLLTVNERIFSMPLPKVIPQRIVAQFEQDEEYEQIQRMGGSIQQEGGNMGVSQYFANVGTSSIS